MRNVTADTITEAVLQTIANTTEPRLRQVMTSLIRHLHAFAREVELTPDEWMAAMEFLVRVGETTQTDRNEFILASDTLGVSALIDLLHNRNSDGATTSSLLGPFYIHGERMQPLEVGGDLIGDNEGEPVVVAGRVITPQGAPIAGACLEIWQNAANGMYESEDPEHGPGNLRCKMFADDAGRYRFTTIKPVAYTVPYDGPVGTMLQALGRHAWRPAHIHFRITAAGYRPLVTELFVADDGYIDTDAVFGVREPLLVDFRRIESDEEAAGYGVTAGYALVVYDFGLQPEA